MVTPIYRMGRSICRFVQLCCIRLTVLHRNRLERSGGFVLACTHLSHIEPMLLTAMVDRQIDWMSRIEFHKYRIVSYLLEAGGGFSVDRNGVPVKSIRTAIEKARDGKIVGIFPEGGVARGKMSVMQGGAIKKGACVVSYRAKVPILPVVVLGTDALTRVGPWLPFKRARLWVIVGSLVHPRLDEPRRKVARELMAQDLQVEFQAMYRELCATCGLGEPEKSAVEIQ